MSEQDFRELAAALGVLRQAADIMVGFDQGFEQNHVAYSAAWGVFLAAREAIGRILAKCGGAA